MLNFGEDEFKAQRICEFGDFIKSLALFTVS